MCLFSHLRTPQLSLSVFFFFLSTSVFSFWKSKNMIHPIWMPAVIIITRWVCLCWRKWRRRRDIKDGWAIIVLLSLTRHPGVAYRVVPHHPLWCEMYMAALPTFSCKNVVRFIKFSINCLIFFLSCVVKPRTGGACTIWLIGGQYLISNNQGQLNSC